MKSSENARGDALCAAACAEMYEVYRARKATGIVYPVRAKRKNSCSLYITGARPFQLFFVALKKFFCYDVCQQERTPMKIEKLNDNQIRCTLTREDLLSRHIKLSELAYGTEKTKALFHDMMSQASRDFGFEAEDMPVMIEAIPLSPEKIVLIITKVDCPDELDTRFSEFTQFCEESFEEPQLTEAISSVGEFAFSSMEDAVVAAKASVSVYHGHSTLYKNPATGEYRLFLQQYPHDTPEFARILVSLGAYLPRKKYFPGAEGYWIEHGKLILAKGAIDTLAQL